MLLSIYVYDMYVYICRVDIGVYFNMYSTYMCIYILEGFK